MKRFAKAFACACLAVCCAFMLVACGGGVEGTYKLYSISGTYGETELSITADDYNAAKAKQEAGEEELTENEQMILMAGTMFEEEMAMILEKDGVLKASEGGEVNEETGTYTVDGETITMVMGPQTIEGTIKDGAITVVIAEANMTMVYKK